MGKLLKFRKCESNFLKWNKINSFLKRNSHKKGNLALIVPYLSVAAQFKIGHSSIAVMASATDASLPVRNFLSWSRILEWKIP